MTQRIPLRAAVLAASLATAAAAFAAPHVAEPAYLNNAEARCTALPAAARDACVARVRGAGGATGSVSGGGILYGTSGAADTTYHGSRMHDGTATHRKPKAKKARKAKKPVMHKAAAATPAPAAAPVAATKAPPQTPGAQPASKVSSGTVGQAVSNAAKATASAAKTTATAVKSAASKAVSK